MDNQDTWGPNLASITRCHEINLVEIVLKLRNIHWNMGTSPIYDNLVVIFLESTSLIGADIPSPTYERMRFSPRIHKILPVSEDSFDFVDYKVKGRPENRTSLQQVVQSEEITRTSLNLIEIIRD